MASQRSFLGEAATRLIRALDLSGLISPKFQDGQEILPVILVSDATVPGMGDRRGRRWAVGKVQAGGGATQAIGLKARADIIVERIQAVSTSGAGSELRLFYNGVNDADPIALATADVIFIDRATTATELAPAFSGAVTPLVVAGANIWRSTILVNGLQEISCVPILLAAGAKLHLTCSGVADLRVNFYGRVF